MNFSHYDLRLTVCIYYISCRPFLDLQKTPYDDQCALRIYAYCDDVMARLMKELNLSIPSYTNLDLWSDVQWLEQFERNWPFR